MNLLSATDQCAQQSWLMQISERIQRGRKAKGLSQRAVAKLMKVSPSAVAQWEVGGTEPSIDNRIELSVILGIPILDLLPSGASAGEIIIKDPREKFLIERFRLLSERLRETYLQLILVQSEEAAPTPEPTPRSD